MVPKVLEDWMTPAEYATPVPAITPAAVSLLANSSLSIPSSVEILIFTITMVTLLGDEGGRF